MQAWALVPGAAQCFSSTDELDTDTEDNDEFD